MPQIPETERAKFEVYVKDVMPLIERLNKATRDSLIPALADGQSAFVIDGKFESKRLQAQLPEWEKAMPLPEFGLVMSVSDAKLLKRGVSEYYAVAGDMLEVIRKNEPNAIPEGFELPRPTVTESSGNTIYSYPPPPECGMDKNFVPNAGLSDKVAVISLSLTHTERLLRKTPFAAGGVLVKTDRPAGGRRLVQLVGPPRRGGALDRLRPGTNRRNCSRRRPRGGHRPNPRALGSVEMLPACITMESHLEDGILVTHSLLEIRDVAK